MGFADWGLSQEESKQRKQEHEAGLDRIRREGNAEVARINGEIRASSRAHADYQRWMRSTGRTDIPFQDWLAGRYAHVIVRDEF